LGIQALIDGQVTRASEECLRQIGNVAIRWHRREASIDAAVLSSVAFVESYVNRLLELYLESSAVAEDRAGAMMIGKLKDVMQGTWVGRREWLSGGFGVPLGSLRAWPLLLALVELRNAIVHGGGGLTTRQSKTLKERLRVEASLRKHLSAEVQGSDLLLTTRTADSAISICRDFVTQLDPLLAGLDLEARAAPLRV
jgi:hypothetical protein